MKVKAICVYLITVLLIPVACFSGIHTVRETEVTLDRVLTALESGLRFLGREYKRVNLDAVIGTRIVDGQLQVLLRHLRLGNYSHISPHVVEKVARRQRLAESISDMATPWIAMTQPKYYAKIGTLLNKGFWQLDYSSRNIDPSLFSPPQYVGEAMKEVQSDDCLAEYFGTGKYTKEKCKISAKCWDLMTVPGYRRYSLTHEVFYLEIGELYGCYDEKMLRLNDQLNAGFCTNILVEAETIANHGFLERWRDLFMEQAALCGTLGYRQFFRFDWINHILRWQRPNGCYGVDRSGPDLYTYHRRVKREEKQFESGCQCHRTTVAVAALGQYVRYLIEYLEMLKANS